MKIKCNIVLLTVILIGILFQVTANASYSDVPSDAIFKDSVERLSALEVISGGTDGTFSPWDYLTRAQFSKIAINAAGLKEQAQSQMGVSIFNDVDPYGWASGYINMAAKQNYINGYGNGYFQPDENINYAQVLTVLLKMLGYTSDNMSGVWPYNYIQQAAALDITDGVEFQPTDAVTRGIAALLVDRALLTNMRKASATEQSVTLLEKSGLAVLKECIITATFGTDTSVTQGKVKTDSGDYTIKDIDLDAYIGKKIKVFINDDNEIIAIQPKDQSTQQVVVDSVTGNDIRILQGGGISPVITLPDSLDVYYHGTKGTFSNNKQYITLGSNLILAGAYDGSYDYAILLDPVLDGPVTALKDVTGADEYIGNIDIRDKSNIQVIRNGEGKSLSDIKAYDVVYALKNAPDQIVRLLVYDKKITGNYDSASPSKAFVNKITISGQEIEVGTQKAASKLDESAGAYKFDDRITALTGKDGKVVDVVDINATDVSNYAVVVNVRQDISTDDDTKGQRVYYVTLFKTDGTSQEYQADDDYTDEKGELVTFDFSNGVATLEKVSYNKLYGAIDKSLKMLEDIWLSKDVVIFDLVRNPSNADTVVKKVKLSDLYMDRLDKDDVICAVTGNAFGDIQLLFLDNVTYSSYQYGMVTDMKDSSGKMNINCSYEVDVKGKKYSFKGQSVKYPVGESMPVAIDMEGNTLNSMLALSLVASSTSVEAYDDERIKINGKIYRMSPDVQLYHKETMWEYVPASINGITDYKGTVNLYAERDPQYGGIIRVIVLK